MTIGVAETNEENVGPLLAIEIKKNVRKATGSTKNG